MTATARIDRTETPPDAPIDLADVRQRILANRRALTGAFFERTDILKAFDVAAICQEHVLLVGLPGTAKSDMARVWASQFGGGLYHEHLFTRQSTISDHLAYLDVKAFTEGRHEYRYDGKLTEAHIAFGDECFKATGGFLNALLGWLNERNVLGGYKSPLVTFIGASNEFGEDESVAALEDRLLIRFWVEPIGARANLLAFLSGSATPRAALSLAPVLIAELRAAHEASRAIPCDPLVFDALADIRQSLKGAGHYVSDRRLAKCVRILQAFAWLDGASAVEVDHVDFLRNVLWRRPEDRPAVEAALGAINRGIVGEIRTLVDKALQDYQAAKDAQDFAQHALSAADKIRKASLDIKARFGSKNVPDRVKDRIKAYQAELKAAFDEAKAASAELRI